MAKYHRRLCHRKVLNYVFVGISNKHIRVFIKTFYRFTSFPPLHLSTPYSISIIFLWTGFG